MELIVAKEVLIKTLDIVGRISAKSQTLPVLQCVVIKAEVNQITIEATNLEIGIIVPITGQVLETGVVAVPTQTLLQSIQFLDQKEITLRTEDQVIQIETPTSSTSIKTFSIDDFPNIHKATGEELSLNGDTLAYAIKSVAFAASVTSIKPELSSVFFQQKKEHSLTCVATDSFRLIEKTVTQKGLVLDYSFMVPAKNAIELARVCEILNEPLKMVVTENQCALTFSSGVYIVSRLITGSFPDYTQIIPKEFVSTATILKEDLQQALKKTNIFLNKFRQVSITITENNLTVSSRNNEVGHTTDTIKAQVTGEELSLNFNQQYIIEPLPHIQDDSILLKFAGVGRSVVIEGVSEKTLKYLVMPMNK